MKLVFVSNYYNHHQQELCRYLHLELKGEFTFLKTSNIPDFRRKLGYKELDDDFVVDFYKENKFAMEQIENADVFIVGGVKKEIENIIFNTRKDIYVYSERIYKKNIKYFTLPLRFFKYLKYNRKNCYLLSASAFAYSDYKLTGNFINKAYKFGYFPKLSEKSETEISTEKNDNSILWVGRMIKYKNPFILISLAAYLNQRGINFNIDVIGSGDLEEDFINTVSKKNLNDKIKFHGAINSDDVRSYMEKSSILLCTSNKEEGWGAVVNEGMSSGCCVIASKDMGSAKYLIDHGIDGYIYDNNNSSEFFSLVEKLLLKKEIVSNIGIASKKKMENTWNAKIVAKRLIKVMEYNLKDKENLFFNDGPLSKA